MQTKSPIYQDEYFYIEVEESEIPWLKIFPLTPYKEISDMPRSLREIMWSYANIVEKNMIEYYQPQKINIASFGNMLPQVHIHVMARFSEDSWFPNPTWGEKLRDSKLELPPFEPFLQKIVQSLTRAKRNEC